MNLSQSSHQMSIDDYIAWAQAECPVPVAPEQSSLQEAVTIYDEVDNRLGDEAEGDDFFTRAMWLEMAIRLAEAGWTIDGLETARGPHAGRSVTLTLIGLD